MTEKVKAIICIFVLFVCGLYLATWQADSDVVKMGDWARTRDAQVVVMEHSYFDYGPFIVVGRNDRVYLVKIMKDGKMQEGYARIRNWILGSEIEVSISPIPEGLDK